MIKLNFISACFIAIKRHYISSYFLPNPFPEDTNSLGKYYNLGHAIEIVSK